MVPIVGGQTARGEKNKKSFDVEEPIHCLLGSQMSIQGSEQGSCDAPDEGDNGEDTNDSVQQLGRGAGSSYTARGQSSEGTISKTGNFGSKRKNTDESSEQNSRRKRYKDRYWKRQAEQNRLADAGFEIARSLREYTEAKMAKRKEINKCLTKLEQLGIVDYAHDFCMIALENEVWRLWFLRNDRDAIFRWIHRNMGFRNNALNPMSKNNAPNQGYPQPNPAANNYVQQLGRGAGSSYTARGQSSEGTFLKTGNFGSKRKNTDESSEQNSRRKRYKDRYWKRQAEQNRLADAGFEIAQSMREYTKAKMAKTEEIYKCLTKLKQLGIVDYDNYFCMTALENEVRRLWFLRNDRDAIFRWIHRNMDFRNNALNPMSKNNAPNQGYPQPNPAANNYGFHPSNLNH